MHCAETSQFIQALLKPELYDHAVTEFRVVETHISWVILTGNYAYKIKKPVNLGFLDFSTLALRHKYCEEELRLNQRLAPEFYLAVVPISGTPEQPRLDGKGTIFDYAVKMRQFPIEMELDHVARTSVLTEKHIEKLAFDIAALHRNAACADPQSPYGNDESIWQPIKENFQLIRSSSINLKLTTQLDNLWDWCIAIHGQHMAIFHMRKQRGFIRECHGDLHLANMFIWKDRIVVFDCLEFNPTLRWIDVISDIAFLLMDLRDRGLVEYARIFLNNYLQETGDYMGINVLDMYQVYRAMVRAKVACIRIQQSAMTGSVLKELQDQVVDYVKLAQQLTQSRIPILFITHGFSGSGKTFCTRKLIREFDMLRIRSDVERKRLAGLSALQSSQSGINQGIYSEDWSTQTYAALANAARQILKAGYHVLVDATFLKYSQRKEFHTLAVMMKIPFVILAFHATRPILSQRIQSRQSAQQDASEADLSVLEQQSRQIEPISTEEKQFAMEIDSEKPDVEQHLVELVKQLMQRSALQAEHFS